MIQFIRKPSQNKKRSGAAMVEMALVLPIFFMVVLGIIEFGRGMMVANLVTNAAREGARLGVLDGTSNADVRTAIQNFLTAAATVSSGDIDIQITITPAPGNTNPGNECLNAQSRDLVNIRVAIPFDKVSMIPGSYLAGKTLVGQSAMRHE
jgi:Flp pilus assembly protein TadG